MAIYRAFWLEFCLSTGIRGFSYIAKSKQKTEHFLWLLVVSTFIILTFYDVTNTCLLYVSEETVSRVTVKSNSTINLGTPTICLEFNVAQMSPDLSKFDLDLMLHRHNETNLTDLYLNPNVHTDFNSSTMFLLTLITLTKIVYAEQFVHPSAPVSQFSLGILSDKISESSPPAYRLQESGTFETIDKMKKFLISKFDFTQLQKILGTSLCSLMGLSVRRNRFEDGLWQETEAKPCKQSAITWLGLPPTIAIDKEVLCVKIDPDIALFSFSAESVEIMVRSKPLHPTTYELKDHGYMYLNFNDDFISMSSQNTLWVPVESIMAADILVFGQYREILTTADPCGSISVDLCRLKCRMSYLMKFCNCKPLSYHAFWELSNSPVCGHHVEILQNQSLLGINPECLIVHRDTRPDKNCSLKCKKPCNYQVLLYLTYNDKSTKKKYKIVNSTTVISLSVDPFTFPLFEEFPLMTYKQFIAAIGGNLSFYLGISFIALIHIAVFLSQMCYGNGWKNSADSTSFPIE